jgi:hypothetical protein
VLPQCILGREAWIILLADGSGLQVTAWSMFKYLDCYISWYRQSRQFKCGSSFMKLVCFVPLQVCFKRNVHGRTLKEIQKLANGWEASPALYTLLDVSGLFQDDAGADKVCRQTTPADCHLNVCGCSVVCKVFQHGAPDFMYKGSCPKGSTNGIDNDILTCITRSQVSHIIDELLDVAKRSGTSVLAFKSNGV